MSGFQNVTGFAPPTSAAGIAGLLQTASFRGVPFKVVAAQIKKGRRQAIHEYPYRDGGWPEDLGRAMRVYSFSGHLIGDLAPVMQLALDTVLEMPGSGLLIHPSIGAVWASVISASTGLHRDNGRMVSVEMVFIEDKGNSLTTTLIATAVSVLLLATAAIGAVNTDLGGIAGNAVLAGSAVIGAGQSVVDQFGMVTWMAACDGGAILSLASGLAPPDLNTSFGRFAGGAAESLLPSGTAAASLGASLAASRSDLTASTAQAGAAVASLAGGSDVVTPLVSMIEALRAGIIDPAEQIRVLLAVGGFTPAAVVSGNLGLAAAIGRMTEAMGEACRRAVLIGLARSSAAWQPASYDDASAMRQTLAAAFDGQITEAADDAQDASYAALTALRTAVLTDLIARGASLPAVRHVAFAAPLPALVIAQMLYQDASRADQIIGESAAIHPAFCPLSFGVLSA